MKIFVKLVLVVVMAASLFSCQTERHETPIPQSLMASAREAVTGSGGADSITGSGGADSITGSGGGEYAVIQNGRTVGVMYAPPASSPSQSNQYWALSSEYVYLNSQPNAKFDLVPIPSQYNNFQDFHVAMKARFRTGKFVTVNVVTDKLGILCCLVGM